MTKLEAIKQIHDAPHLPDAIKLLGIGQILDVEDVDGRVDLIAGVYIERGKRPPSLADKVLSASLKNVLG